MGGIITPNAASVQNPMMTYNPQQGSQMPFNQVNPQSLDPQALYAYNQMVAIMKSKQGMNPQQLSPEIMARNNAIMQLYFPQLKNF